MTHDLLNTSHLALTTKNTNDTSPKQAIVIARANAYLHVNAMFHLGGNSLHTVFEHIFTVHFIIYCISCFTCSTALY